MRALRKHPSAGHCSTYLCVETSYHDYEHCMLTAALLPFHQQLFLSNAQEFAFHTMANAVQGPTYLS